MTVSFGPVYSSREIDVLLGCVESAFHCSCEGTLIAPRYEHRDTHVGGFFAIGRLGDEPRGGGEGTMSMLEGEEGVRADDDYAKGG